MKWSYEYVWSKVEEIVPHAKIAKMDLPEALKASAITLFLKGEGSRDSYRAYVISEALHELKHWGHLSFATVNEDWM